MPEGLQSLHRLHLAVRTGRTTSGFGVEGRLRFAARRRDHWRRIFGLRGPSAVNKSTRGTWIDPADASAS